jgi:hypothetical protein
MQHVLFFIVSLFHCCLFRSFNLGYFLNLCTIFKLFVVYLFSCFVYFALYFISYLFCILFLSRDILVYFLFVYNFTDCCHRVEAQLQ